MKVITQAQLIEVLATLPGAKMATLVTETDARLKKTGNPFGQVNKRSVVNCVIGFRYEAAVNRQQVREGAAEGGFEAQERKWGEHLNGCLWLIYKDDNKDNLYLQVKVEKSIEKPTYLKAISREALDYDLIKPFLPAKKSNAEAQGVDKEIILRDYKMSSIKEVHVGGEQYTIVPQPAAVEASTSNAPVEAVPTAQPEAQPA